MWGKKMKSLLHLCFAASINQHYILCPSEASLGGPQPDRGGGIHGLSQQPGFSADCLPARLPQDGRLPLHSQCVHKHLEGLPL